MPSVSRRFATGASAFARPSGRAGAGASGPVVLMVSGGADSTALLVLAATSELDIDDGRGHARIARERLHVLHVNHQLRGIDAKEDEEFVRELAERYGIPCTVERVNVAALAQAPATGDTNVENVAREVRYAAAGRLANELCEQQGLPRSAARIVTAHTANDRTETFFMNAIKGSGSQGLSSIPRRRNRVVRPLLDRTHAELCDLLRMRGIVWHEDVTNADTHYLRAFVRHEIVPRALARNPRLMENMVATCDILSDEDAYLTQLSMRALMSLERRRAEGLVVLDAGRLAATDVAIARRVVRLAVQAACPECRLEARHVGRVLAIVAAGEGSSTLPLGVDVRVTYGALFVRSRSAVPGALASGWLEVPALASAPGMSATLAAPGSTGVLELGAAGGLAAGAAGAGALAGDDPASRQRSRRACERSRPAPTRWRLPAPTPASGGARRSCSTRRPAASPPWAAGSGLTPRRPATCCARLACTASPRSSPTCSSTRRCPRRSAAACRWSAPLPPAPSCGLRQFARTSGPASPGHRGCC